MRVAHPSPWRRAAELVAAALLGAAATWWLSGSAGEGRQQPAGELLGSPIPSAVRGEDEPTGAELRARVRQLEAELAVAGEVSAARRAATAHAAAKVEEEDVTAGSGALDLAQAPLGELLDQLARAWQGKKWPQATRIAEALDRRARAGELDGLLASLGDPPNVKALRTLAALLSKGMLSLEPHQAHALQESMVQLVETSHDPAVELAATELLSKWLRRGDAPELDEALARRAFAQAGAPGDPAARRALLELLQREAEGHPAAVPTCSALLEREPDPTLRVAALRVLRATRSPEVDELLLATLRREQDPQVLWEASSAANFLTQPAASTHRYKDAYRELISGGTDDVARGRAAQSLALLAVLDGDEEVPRDLRQLAATTADPLLAEFARQVARQLESGHASIVTISEAWKPWHESLDRQRFP